ncbi:hypothetical protein [Flavobacterium sp. 3HN19-14]|uniref:hypothetical protein n=1 Tax=Flavobacterium sp. 3HN19-14 TaxID=3448133 RepID=UPI003EE349A4
MISEYEVRGLRPAEIPVFLKLIDFSVNTKYTARNLTEALRSAFATRDFTRINYTLIPAAAGSARIIFDVDKAPDTAIRLGLSYNSATGIAFKTGLVKRNFLTSFSTASFAVSVGENQRAKAAFSKYLTKSRNLIIQATTSGETTDITTYDAKFSDSGSYNQSALNGDLQLLFQPNNNMVFGVGTTFDNVVYDPEGTSSLVAEGNLHFLNSYFTLQYNDLNASLYPIKGTRFNVQAGVVYSQRSHYTIYNKDEIVATQDSPFFDSNPYTQLRLSLEHYIPTGSDALFLQLQSGMNFNYHQAIMNDFVIGGLNNIIRNQVNFAGLPEASVFTSSVVSLQVGYQHEIINNLYLTGKINGLWFDFIKSNYRINSTSRGMGYALTGGYKTLFGPIEASLMYSDLNHKILPYFNIGYVLSL